MSDRTPAPSRPFALAGTAVWVVAAWTMTSVSLSGCGVLAWGEQAAVGPVLGYVPSRGVSFGWEAGGGAVGRTGRLTSSTLAPTDFNALLRGNLGMSWRPGGAGTTGRETIAYLAWEPWYSFAGGTLGYAHSFQSPSRLLAGGWLGVALPTEGNGCFPCYTVSIALGWRWNGVGEFYLAPKVGVMNDVAFSFGD